MICQPRVSLTLSRGAAEASIFAVHCTTTSPEVFGEIWNSGKGTGRKVLNLLQGVPYQLEKHLRIAWKITAPLGHASPIPVMSALTSFQGGDTIGRGLAVAGEYAGPMDESTLRNLGNTYGLVSAASVQALSFCLHDELKPFARWSRQYSKVMETLQLQVPIPKALQPHIPRLRERLKTMGIGD